MKSGQRAGRNASESEDAATVAMAEHELPVKIHCEPSASKRWHDGEGGNQWAN
jgi:hypothetical protein